MKANEDCNCEICTTTRKYQRLVEKYIPQKEWKFFEHLYQLLIDHDYELSALRTQKDQYTQN
jgi:hypothetical protein